MNDRHRFLRWALKENEEAIALCEQLAFIAHVWDDLVDGEINVEDGVPEVDAVDRINRAFWTALIEIPCNPFFQRHHGHLVPVLRQIGVDWMTANTLEVGDQHEQTLAFVLRSGINGLAIQCAYLIGGYDWMQHVSLAVRRAWHTETLGEYLEG